MKNKIKAFFKKHPGTSIKSKLLSKKLHIFDEYEYAQLKAHLHQLTEEGFLTRQGKKYRQNVAATESGTLTGKLEVHSSGYGFVLFPNSPSGDIFVAQRNMATALHGDTVEVTLFAKQKKKVHGKRLEGMITRVLKRSIKEISGILIKTNSFYAVRPDMPQIQRNIYIAEEHLKDAKPGMTVVVKDIVWDNPKHNPEGKISEVLGKPDSPEVELISIAKEFNLPYKFSKKILNEAKAKQVTIDKKEAGKRLDYRAKTVFTIDPDDAKDFDDALSLEKLENGNYSVGVHIADVSHYVDQDSFLDAEAAERGNSVYLVGAVIPMLPEHLSNNICSLVPNEDRLTYSVITEITPRGRIANYKIAKTIINSKRRFSYEEAQQIIETGKGDLAEEVLQLNKLAGVLRKKRVQAGSVEFSTQEVKFVLDENGVPTSVLRRKMKESNHLVEEFMLLANRIIAGHMSPDKRNEKGKPFVYRVHDRPDSDKLKDFNRFIRSLGYSVSVGESDTGKQLNQLMSRVKGKPEETIIGDMAIRSMAKAIYSTENIGHFGLGFKDYTHFTSPIRRFSDLLVHRILFAQSESKSKKTPYQLKPLEQLCEHLSNTERNAMEAERFSIRKKHIRYLQPLMGEIFEGIISGVTNFGIFVKLLENLAEGLVHVRDLDGDFYDYDEKKFALIGRSKRKIYKLGDYIKVQLIRVDSEKSMVDFKIIDDKDGENNAQ